MKKYYNTPLVEQTCFVFAGSLCVSPGVNDALDLGGNGSGNQPGEMAPGRGKVF